MPKITSKLQITIPKRLAEQVGLRPGDEVEFLAAGDGIRMVPAGKSKVGGLSTAERLRLFRVATERQQARDKARPLEPVEGEGVEGGRGWTREELYIRAKPR